VKRLSWSTQNHSRQTANPRGLTLKYGGVEIAVVTLDAAKLEWSNWIKLPALQFGITPRLPNCLWSNRLDARADCEAYVRAELKRAKEQSE
jgi:hypothetical protein